MKTLRAPFPYFGYKGKVSAEVWSRLGNPPNYVEPFFGSGAVLLQRSEPGKREVVNDKYGALVNFWRSVQYAPTTVAQHAVTIGAESELHARNAAVREALDELTSRLEGDPEYYDPKLAGWWCYVQCCAIGETAFARGPWVRENGLLVKRPRARGIRRAVPCDADRGIQKSIPFHGKQGIMSRKESAQAWIAKLSARLARVRVLCGDWSRAVKPTYTTQHGLTGVFLDPPYEHPDYDCYANSQPLLKEICKWCLENGSDPKLRIALCGYAETLQIDLVAAGWVEYAWKASGGRVTTGGQSDKNRELERIWFSPHCLREVEGQLSMFGGCHFDG